MPTIAQKFQRAALAALIAGLTSNADTESSGYGTGVGSSRMAIARVATIPNQTFATAFTVEVAGYHREGINRVTIQANGGEIVALRGKPQGSPDLYSIPVQPLATDGQVDVQIVVYPNVGFSHVLTLRLWSNASGTLSTAFKYVAPTDHPTAPGNDTTGNGSASLPYATIERAIEDLRLAGQLSGATVYLLAGTHAAADLSWPTSQASTTERLFTIQAAPGLAREDVTLVGATSDNRLGSIKHTRIKDMRVLVANGKFTYGSYIDGATFVYDNCLIDGVDRTTASEFNWPSTGYNGGKFAVDCYYINVKSGTEGGGTVVRNVTVDTYVGDAFSGAALLINAVAKNQHSSGTGAHADIGQYYGHASNVIWINVTATENLNDTQGFFQGVDPEIQTLTNAALINVNIDTTGGEFGYMRALLLQSETTHMLISGCNFNGATAFDEDFDASDVVIEDTDFSDSPGVIEGVTYR